MWLAASLPQEVGYVSLSLVLTVFFFQQSRQCPVAAGSSGGGGILAQRLSTAAMTASERARAYATLTLTSCIKNCHCHHVPNTYSYFFSLTGLLPPPCCFLLLLLLLQLSPLLLLLLLLLHYILFSFRPFGATS